MFTSIAVGILLTPVAIYLAVLSGGMGHGDYALARVLFPYSMLLTRVTGDTISPGLIGLAFAQFPLYGVAIGWATTRNRTWQVVAPLTLFHLVAVAVCFSGAIPNFS